MRRELLLLALSLGCVEVHLTELPTHIDLSPPAALTYFKFCDGTETLSIDPNGSAPTVCQLAANPSKRMGKLNKSSNLGKMSCQMVTDKEGYPIAICDDVGLAIILSTLKTP